MPKRLETEVLIVGAGPAGSSLAILLAQRGVETTLVDRFHFPRRKACASCFSPKCLPALERLGLRETVESGQRMRYISVQGPHLSARLDATRNPLGAFFYVFPRERFDLLLVEKAKGHSVNFLPGLPVEALITEGGYVRGALSKDIEIRAKVTAIATGANSRFLPQAFRGQMRTYQTLIGWYEVGSDLDPETTDSYTAPWLMGSGWIFPESEHIVNVGVMVHEEGLRSSKKKLTWFLDGYLATPYVRGRLKGATRRGALRGSPIRYSPFPHGICGNGFLMVGEASLLTHPMTGEGISQALRSAAIAAEVLGESISAREYSASCLSAYDTRIRQTFRRNFLKAGVLRWGLDRFTLFEAFLGFLHFHPWSVRLAERKLNRIVF